MVAPGSYRTIAAPVAAVVGDFQLLRQPIESYEWADWEGEEVFDGDGTWRVRN